MSSGQCCFTDNTQEKQIVDVVLIQRVITVYFIVDSRKDRADCKGQGHGKRSNNV